MQDAEQFIARARADSARRAFLSDGSDGHAVTVTRAPGRLDVMGGVGDYSGTLVAEATIGEAALVALAPRTDRRLRLWSFGAEADGLAPQADLSLDDFSTDGRLADYATVHARLTQDPATRWAAYVAGCFFTLLAEGVVSAFPHGANLLLESTVPLGAGVSSSAAIEVATMQAINVAYGLDLDGQRLAALAQKTENNVVGAPCGIMDQMTSALGTENSLFLLLCQPHEVQGTQPLPPGVGLWGINSAVKHSVGGSAYTRARVAAFMGRKILGHEYLAHCHPAMFFSDSVPASISGADFLTEHGETGDPVTRIDPGMDYPVWAATAHAIHEHERVQQFTSMLEVVGREPAITHAALKGAGELMYAAHDGYTRIGLGAEETDLLVGMARDAGPSQGVYGAKISGGGSGGTVAFLTYGDKAEQTIRRIANEYATQTGLTPQIVRAGASPGAVQFGYKTLDL